MDGEQLGLSARDLEAVRELARRAHPETVPELVTGESVATILASLEPAAAAYRRIAGEIAARESPPAAPAPPVVPAGSAPPVALDLDRLPAVEKIRRALAN
ncbi:MAG: hypothetical protein U0031_22210 [Thermomicrobiales bacterium]